LFGAWNSTDAVPGKVKFARALVSEIVAYYAEKGVKVGGRIDPLGIEKIGIYRVPSQETTAKAEEANYRTEAGETKIVYATATNGWTTDVAQARKTETGEPLYYQKREGETWTALEGEAARDKEGNLVRYKLKKEHVGKPSEINHGNIPPAVAIAEKTMEGPDGSKLSERNKPLPGGITMRYAEQTTVLSMAALRRLRFPVTQPTAASPSSPAVQSSQPNSEPIVETETSATPSPNAIHPPQKTPAERDVDARMMLTALGLAVMVCSRQDYFLRSRCDLYAPELIKFEIVQQGSAKFEEFTLTLAQAATLLRDVTGQSSAQWKSQADLPTLRPSQKLADLIRESRRRSGSEDNSE
jgi:CRISPR-associated protein Csb1